MFRCCCWIRLGAARTLKVPLDGTMVGKARFDVKSSWVSTTTLVGALLISALKDGFLPKPNVTWLGGLNLLFVGLAVVALLIYFASERVEKTKNGDEYLSSVRAYLSASAIALCAGFGQLLTLIAVIVVAPEANLPIVIQVVFAFSIVLAAVALGIYAWKAMEHQINTQLRRPPPPGVDAAPAPPAEWPLL